MFFSPCVGQVSGYQSFKVWTASGNKGNRWIKASAKLTTPTNDTNFYVSGENLFASW